MAGIKEVHQQEPVEQLSESATATEGEEMVETELTSVIGKVNLEFLEGIPIIGTAFGIFTIVEDFMQQTTLGYIDAGFDIVITCLTLLGPKVEPAVIAFTVRMDTFYTEFSKEFNKLLSDASLISKISVVFKGIKQSVVDIFEQFTLIGQIFGAIDNSTKLDEEYAKQQEFCTI